MQRKVVKLLRDMMDAGEAIQSYARGLTQQEFLADRQRRHATEREFEIIGEALRRLTIETPGLASRISHVDQIIGFRNILAHGYDSIREADLWVTVTRDVPILLREMQVILEEHLRP